ncbi:unnamed protein product [Urochloa humidicola]
MTKLSVPAHHGRRLPTSLRHASHEAHILKLVPDDDGVEFLCDGCKMPGAGARYECGRRRRHGGTTPACNFDLHTTCALATGEREIGGFRFVFLLEPDGRRICDACGGGARGFLYHCPDLDHDVHPCCADLPGSFRFAGLSFELSMEEDPPHRCVLCPENKKKKKKKGAHRGGAPALWSYRCEDAAGDGGGALSLHVACARNLAASESFVNVNNVVALHKAAAGAAESVVNDEDDFKAAFRVFDSREEVVPINAAALRALLLRGRGGAVARGRGGGAWGRSLRVLGFVVRVVIGIIFGDPTAMIAAVAAAVFPRSSSG